MGIDVEVTASITCLRDAIASDDWAARKAAAEALVALALEHTDLLTTYKSSCVTFFEARRFDKVKVVRESMNRMIEVWKEISGAEEDECSSALPPASQSQRRPSLTDATPIKVVMEEKLLKGRGVRDRLESRRTLFKGSEDRSTKLAAHKAGSRVVPYEGGGNLEEISEVEGGSERYAVHKDESFSEIRTHLLQIEN
uniref:TORTIFOLIA1/SINE1-2 N-terminal domain-containing protein n=1 Tax=Zea mays TaxID=4577 RepID=A0A804PHU3_MAIZE